MNSDIHTLAGAYALDAVDEVERAGFERHLTACDTCRLEVAELRETAARLADDTPDDTALPAGLRERTLAQAARTPQERLTTAESRRTASTPRWRQWVAAASIAAVAATGASVVTWAVVDDRDRQEQPGDDRIRQIAEVVAAGDARVHQEAVDGGGSATVVSSAQRDQAVAVLRELPDPGVGRAYQLWLIPSAGAPRTAGLLPAGNTATTTLVGPLTDVAAFGVSNEPASGSPAPTDVVVLVALR
ncbi:anti-sigma factor [Micromonospora sp. NPDC047793]|uniref:anti-sigma factor n=1 Tax=unclassified Micromonospora TaxID=2617518 RepID=UPI0033D27832